MFHYNRMRVVQMNYSAALGYLLLIATLSLSAGCSRRPRIAVIPRTTGVMLWEAERTGAFAAAEKYGYEIYWNAPTREDDVEGQIAFLERVIKEKFNGVVLAPDQALALMTPVRKVIAEGIPAVVVSSPLPLASQAGLSYILNDDAEAGRLAARRVGSIIGGKGTVGLLSLDPNLLGLMAQVHAFEATLQREFPSIEVADRRLGAFNGAEVQQITGDVLRKNPGLDALVSFTAVATRGAYLALQQYGRQHTVKLIGSEQEGDIIEAVARGEINSVLAQDTYRMGFEAIETIAAFRRGDLARPQRLLRPLLVTRDNVDTKYVRTALDYGWSGTQ